MLKILSSRKSPLTRSPNAYVHQGTEILKMCRKCYSFNYRNGWYFDKPEYLNQRDADEEISVQLAHCPACAEEELASVADIELFRAFMSLKNKSYANTQQAKN